MVIKHFLHWKETARVAERMAAASALARTYLASDLSFEDRCGAEAALTLLLDDPSEKVRGAMAEALCYSHAAPRQIVETLASDQPDVAAPILVRSPLLTDIDLIDRIAEGDPRAQIFIAMRGSLSVSVSAALAEIGHEEACLELLTNRGAQIAALSFRRMAERFGHVATLREALLADSRLSPDTRHLLVTKLAQTLRELPLVVEAIGQKRARIVTREACTRASLTLIDGTAADDMPVFADQMRLSGELSAGFVIRLVAFGKIDFFGSVLAALSGHDESRVRSLLKSGRDIGLSALFRAAGLPREAHAMMLVALKLWREVATGKRISGPQEISWHMMRAVEAEYARNASRTLGELVLLLKTIHLDVLRENARDHALAIAAA